MTRPLADAVPELARRLARHTQGELLADAASRARYATDASIYQIVPAAVFVPRSADDVAAALGVARELLLPVVPRGAGTSQCGQTVGAGLVIDCSKHLNRVLAIDASARRAQVEPGVVLDHLNARLAALGLWFPVDVSTSAQATLGGMAGNNSCGSRSIAYGNMVHNVLGIDAWLADGECVSFGPLAAASGRAAAIGEFLRTLANRHRAEIEAHWPKVLRRVAGYNLDLFHPQSEKPYTTDGSVNLAHLLVGAEGSLAFTRSLHLALAPLPRHKVLGVCNFARFRDAMASARHLVALGPTAVELVDRTMIELALTNPAFAPTMRGALVTGDRLPEAILLVEFAGDERAPLLQRLTQLGTLMADLGHADRVVQMPEPAAQKALWEVRKAGLNIMMSLKGDGKPVSFIEDCAVPLEHLADYTDALTEVFTRHGTRGTWYAHASVGTLHVRPILDMRRDGAAKMRSIAEEAAALVRRCKGAYSGEHGDGICRGEWIEWQFGPALGAAFRAIKQELDPGQLFNPGKIIDPPKMDDGALFRFPPPSAPVPYRRIPIQPLLDWSAWNVQADPLTETTSAAGTGGDETGGLGMAVEMCNNNGHCRKFDAGTMCPSWRVTRDEQHLTRGRANTLRMALSGQLGPEGVTSDAVGAALALCVGCKGCKRECPTGVDMARLKIEVTAQRKRKSGFTRRDRLIAHLPDYAGRLGRFAALANLADALPGARGLRERWFGLSAERALPRWRSDGFWRTVETSRFASRETTLAAAPKAAVLFADTFNAHFEPENLHAAAEVLHAAGYTLHLAQDTSRSGSKALCCGRSYLATGMVDAARAKARTLVDVLEPFAAAGVAIVGLEPSCLLTLRDEALVLGLGPAAERVAARSLLFEEFIAHEAAAGRFAPKLEPFEQPLLVHGHCHQKAFAAIDPVLQMLRLVPGAQPTLIESSCCGMAGSFGYEAEHHAISLQMAELSLLPTIRNAPQATVIADGTSCRHQIADGTGRQALHAARWLQGQLAGRNGR